MIHRALTLLAVLHSANALPDKCYPDITKTWGGKLPGDVSAYTPNPGLAMTPPALHHGAAVYVGWQVRAEVSLCLDRTSQACFEDVDITMIECKQSLNQGAKLKKDFVRTSAAHGPSWSHLMTNNFLRYWTIFYGIFSLRGEPKHGLWKWTVQGASTSFWWCELGGQYSGNNGLADGTNQQGMEAVWDQLRKSKTINKIGPLGQAAKINTLSDDIIRVDLADSVDASIFRMVPGGSYSRIPSTPNLPELELYLFTGYYNWPQMFDVVPCDAGQTIGENGCNGLKHTFIAALYDYDYSSALGLPGFGLHYEGDTGCPETCGAGGCNCDAVLLDFALDANIVSTPPMDSDIFYIPDRSNASCWEDDGPDATPEPEVEPELEASPPPPPSMCTIIDSFIHTWCPNIDQSSWDSTISFSGVDDPGCTAFVETNGITCKAFCAQFSLGCLRAQDNDGDILCKTNPLHARKPTAENGCLQDWNGQICVCGSQLLP